YVFNTIFVTVSITLIQVLLACMGAYVLCQVKNKATKVFFMVVQFALLYNGATLAVPQYLILANLHAIDNYWSYILPALASTMGIFLVKQSMEANIPEALIEAARIDGASAWRIFWRIVMPLAKPAWLTAGLFSFQAAWSATADGLLFTESYKTLPSVINSVVSGGIARSGSAMAVTVIMMIPPVIVYLVTQSNVLETMSTSGIKD
ncbi:MAG: carbohydrate ABC transporter permease, partial [Acutalibacteraceae bacterium]